MKKLIMLVMMLTVATFADTNSIAPPVPGITSTNEPTPPITKPPYWTIDMMDPVQVEYTKSLLREEIRTSSRPQIILQEKSYLVPSSDPWETIGIWRPYDISSFYRIMILADGELIPYTDEVTITKEGFELGYLIGAQETLEWLKSEETNATINLVDPGIAWTNYINKITGEK